MKYTLTMVSIIIFGSSGMLGRYLVSYLKQYYNIIPINRSICDVYQLFKDKTLSSSLKELIDTHSPEYIINCCGVINKRQDLTISEMYVVNAYFPLILSRLCNNKNIHLIQPTTDCVFSGSDSMYSSLDIPDCYDDYGASKAMSETIKASIIRVSIIGEENNGKSLVEWIKSKKGQSVNGYTNHLWNGVTCLEYSKIVKDIIDSGDIWDGVRTYGSTYKNRLCISKHDLIKEISQVYDLNVEVIKYETPDKCDRTLKPDVVVRKDLVEQIKDMKEFKIS